MKLTEAGQTGTALDGTTTAPAVASVDDHGEMELQLFFVKS